MKIFLLFISISAFAIPAFAHSANNTFPKNNSLNDSAEAVYKMKNYFALKEIVYGDENKISEKNRVFYKAILQNKFSQFSKSITQINELLHTKGQYTDKQRIELLKIQADNYLKTFQYNKALLAETELLKKYDSILTKEESDDIKNTIISYKNLKNTPPQQVVIKNTVVQFTKDRLGLRLVPISFPDKDVDFIFDSGAGISTITESLARKYKFKIFKDYFKVGTSTSIKIDARIGVAPNIKFGDINIKNVVFLVMPDSALYVPQVKYQIYGIIGFPVISALKQIVFSYKDNSIRVDNTYHEFQGSSNFCMEELAPIIALSKDGDTLPFLLDTGANTSSLYLPYFNKYRQSIEGYAKPGECDITGGGGTEKFPCYTLDSVELKSGSSAAILKNIELLTRKSSTSSDLFYGNIGQDFISQFKEITINFDQMFIEFEK